MAGVKCSPAVCAVMAQNPLSQVSGSGFLFRKTAECNPRPLFYSPVPLSVIPGRGAGSHPL